MIRWLNQKADQSQSSGSSKPERVDTSNLDPEAQLSISKAYWQGTLKGFNAVFTPAPGQSEFNPRKDGWEFKPPWIKDDPIISQEGGTELGLAPTEVEDRSSSPLGNPSDDGNRT